MKPFSKFFMYTWLLTSVATSIAAINGATHQWGVAALSMSLYLSAYCDCKRQRRCLRLPHGFNANDIFRLFKKAGGRYTEMVLDVGSPTFYVILRNNKVRENFTTRLENYMRFYKQTYTIRKDACNNTGYTITLK